MDHLSSEEAKPNFWDNTFARLVPSWATAYSHTLGVIERIEQNLQSTLEFGRDLTESDYRALNNDKHLRARFNAALKHTTALRTVVLKDGEASDYDKSLSQATLDAIFDGLANSTSITELHVDLSSNVRQKLDILFPRPEAETQPPHNIRSLSLRRHGAREQTTHECHGPFLATAIRSNKLTHLTLDMDLFQTTGGESTLTDVKQALAAATSLTHLTVNGVNLGNAPGTDDIRLQQHRTDAVLHGLQASRTQLESLSWTRGDFRYSHEEGEDASTSLTKLQEICDRGLTHLTFIKCQGLQDSVGERLVTPILNEGTSDEPSMYNQLQSLTLNECNLTTADYDALIPLIEADVIEHLELRHKNGIVPSENFFASLGHNRSLTTLILPTHAYSTSMLSTLRGSIKRHPSLQRVVFSETMKTNAVDDTALGLVRNTLRFNTHIIEFGPFTQDDFYRERPHLNQKEHQREFKRIIRRNQLLQTFAKHCNHEKFCLETFLTVHLAKESECLDEFFFAKMLLMLSANALIDNQAIIADFIMAAKGATGSNQKPLVQVLNVLVDWHNHSLYGAEAAEGKVIEDDTEVELRSDTPEEIPYTQTPTQVLNLILTHRAFRNVEPNQNVDPRPSVPEGKEGYSMYQQTASNSKTTIAQLRDDTPLPAPSYVSQGLALFTCGAFGESAKTAKANARESATFVVDM